MKIKLLLFTVLLGIFSNLFAQKDEGLNMAKLNVSALAFKSLGVQYERKVSHRGSVAIGLSVIPTGTLSFKSFIDKQINNSRVNINQFKLGTTIFTPEFRYYFGTKGAFHGFYLAPYVRLGNYHLEGPVSYTTDGNPPQERVAIFSGSIFCYSAGLLIGSTFRLSDKIYLDWWIAGASIGGASGEVSATTSLAADEQKGLEDQLKRTDIPLTNIKYTITPNGATVMSSGNVIGIRGLGLNLGFRF